MDTEQLDPVALALKAHYLLTDRGEGFNRESLEAAEVPIQQALVAFCDLLDLEGPDAVWTALAELDDRAVANLLAAVSGNLNGEALRYATLIGLLKLAESIEPAESD